MAILFPFPSSKARVRAMGSANWAEVPGGRGLASIYVVRNILNFTVMY